MRTELDFDDFNKNKGYKNGNYIDISTSHECKRNVSEISPMNNENNAIFKCGWNTPRKVLEEIPTSPVKNQAHENEPLIGFEKFRVRQGMPEFRPVEEGVRGISSSLPMKQELCICSTEEVELCI